MIPIVFTPHALDMLRERSIERDWVERTIGQPDTIEPDPVHGDRTRVFRAVPERDGRILRVVYARGEHQIRVITLFLDRARRPKR